jgi:ubiquinone/menaquinone biosynthesis C-methylase UbiE
VDVSRETLNVARERAAKKSMDTSFSLADAEALPFADHCFDTVVSSLSACIIANPASAFAEMARVFRTNGKILLLEHGRSDRERLARWHWNREPLELAKHAGLKIVRARRTSSVFSIKLSRTGYSDPYRLTLL